MSEFGAFIRVQATGVGTPFSESTVTTASPMPSDVSSLFRSYWVCGYVAMACLSALASSGVNARRACWTRLPSWASTSAGTSFGDWVTKKTPTPFERISRTVCSMASMNGLLASSKSRCASSKKKMSWPSRPPSSGRSCNRSASSHMRKVENRPGPVLARGSSRHEMIPLPSVVVRRRSLVSNSGSPKKASAPLSAKVMRLRRMTPAVAEDRPPSALRSALPSSEVRWVMTARRSLRSSSARPPEPA